MVFLRSQTQPTFFFVFSSCFSSSIRSRCGFVLSLWLVLGFGGSAFGQNLFYLDLTTHGDDQVYEDANDVKNSFQTYGQRADLSIIDLQGRVEFTQRYFVDGFQTTYSDATFYQLGASYELVELSPLITRSVMISGNYGLDGFYNVNDGTPPEFSNGFRYGTGSLDIGHNHQLTSNSSYFVNFGYQSFFKENQVVKDDTQITYSWVIGYDRQFTGNVSGGANISRSETINQDDLITIVTSASLSSSQNLNPQWTLSENIGLSEFQNNVGKDINTVGGVQASYSYGATLNEDIKRQTLEAEGEKKLPDAEYRDAIDNILNPEQPDVLSFGWQREIASINQGDQQRLADNFNLSWQHILSPNANLVLTNTRTLERTLGGTSPTANSVRNNLGAALNFSVKWLDFAFSRTPEQQLTVSYTYERFSQADFWSDFTVANIAIKALL